MALDFYDESQGKPVNHLEETTVLDDESVFLTTYGELTKKINILNLIRAMSGDDEADPNSGIKFFTVDAMREKLNDIRRRIGDNEGLEMKLNEKLREITNEINYLSEMLKKQFENFKEETRELITELERRVGERLNDLEAEDQRLDSKIDDTKEELTTKIIELRNDLTTKVDSIIESITSTGDIADGLANHLTAEINRVDNRITNIYNELSGQDVFILSQVNGLREEVKSLSENTYDVEQMDNILKEIYDRIKVVVISNETDENGVKWDLNNITYDSLIFWNRVAYPLNLPPNVVNGLCITINCTHIVKQIFMRFGTAGINDHHTFVRTKVGTSWSEWTKYLTTKDITIGTDVPTVLESGQIYLQYFI